MLFRGVADVKPMMFIAFVLFIISLPLGYFFGFVLHFQGTVGVWMALPVRQPVQTSCSGYDLESMQKGKNDILLK